MTNENLIRNYRDQISAITGVNVDYVNEWLGLRGWTGNGRFYETLKDRLQKQGSAIRTYATRFPPDIYGDVVNDKNRERVKRLDVLADAVNFLVERDMLQLSPSDVKLICDRAIYLISPETYMPFGSGDGRNVEWEESLGYKSKDEI